MLGLCETMPVAEATAVPTPITVTGALVGCL
jgi:hypothetical protein